MSAKSRAKQDLQLLTPVTSVHDSVQMDCSDLKDPMKRKSELAARRVVSINKGKWAGVKQVEQWECILLALCQTVAAENSKGKGSKI